MEHIGLKSWSEFSDALEKIRQEYGTYTRKLSERKLYRDKNRILFRGIADADWSLQTTLERKTDRRFHVIDYLELATRFSNELESITGLRWKIKDFPDLRNEIEESQDTFRVHLPAYDYLVYLRQHGFPSPLLDWTESPYIAAYFAFYENLKRKRVSVYAYIETPNRVKSGMGGDPRITLMGKYVTTTKRHFAQKSWYTIATEWSYEPKRHTFCEHSLVFDKDSRKQDVLFKITMPASHRLEALSDLEDFNLNHFTLFQSEDSLIKTMEIRGFDLDSD